MTRSSEQILTEWLVLQVQGGSRPAREALARQWYPLLQRYAQALLRNHEDARDAVQETLIADIAEVTATPVGTVKSRLFTARNLLKQHLGGYDEQD
jgi:DNA-directed RNA polymerase specialized sigma24 family protein